MNLKEYQLIKIKQKAIIRELQASPFSDNAKALSAELKILDKKIESDPPDLMTIYGSIGTVNV